MAKISDSELFRKDPHHQHTETLLPCVIGTKLILMAKTLC